MRIDITKFILINILDSCSIWNILSSKVLSANAFEANCDFSLTKFVEYECLFKPRTTENIKDKELQAIFEKGLNSKRFLAHQLSISDIQEVNLLANRKRLGIGELSSIAFAKKINQSFLTDDQNARKLAEGVLGKEMVQTTPHLLGWLFYNGHLGDSDLEAVLKVKLRDKKYKTGIKKVPTLVKKVIRPTIQNLGEYQSKQVKKKELSKRYK